MPPHAETRDDEDARLRAFARDIDDIRARVEARLGAEDLRWIRRVRRVSRGAEVAGRALLHVSLDPVTFTLGVLALWLHKQLEATEIGHTALHGAFDALDPTGELSSKTFRWEVPIDEETWRYVHNVRHHRYTNIAGRDPDIHFGKVRLNERTPWNEDHADQLLYAAAYSLFFATLLNFQYTGLNDLYFGNGRPERFDFVPDDSDATRRDAWRKAMRKYRPYFVRNYVLFPALAGPLFAKVLAGNFLAERMRDVYSAVTIFCGHVGETVADHPEGTRAGSRHRWYAMQVEASQNFEVPLPVSILCGALDRQIEHHLFPHLPTNRLREIAPEVRAACERHGVRYATASWPTTLRRVVRRLGDLRHDAPRRGSSSIGAVADAGVSR